MKRYYAAAAGIFAASGGAFAKLSGHEMLMDLFLARVLLIGIMLLCNSASMTLFVKSLHQTTSSMVPTVISSTFNFVSSAFLGFLLVGEKTSILWWVGMVLNITGLWLVASENVENNNKAKLK
ncbi:transmembrane protein 42-like isoform X1 [Anthonomus grandis grandis]|uniref:transmembrane protein 42-like isoform X1 n=1 Tax=Anthonomus grandis grandis TaxID=2921223 RepID=UPI002165CCAD|nr:transmembrane protein 42-like isoform X1 [Anthonomus grandis grandis]